MPIDPSQWGSSWRDMGQTKMSQGMPSQAVTGGRGMGAPAPRPNGRGSMPGAGMPAVPGAPMQQKPMPAMAPKPAPMQMRKPMPMASKI